MTITLLPEHIQLLEMVAKHEAMPSKSSMIARLILEKARELGIALPEPDPGMPEREPDDPASC
jgi:hypothetical protein